MSIDFRNLAEPVARCLLGEPNKALSSKSELRFGTKGSLAIDLTKGTWYDHERDQGGGMFDLIKREGARRPHSLAARTRSNPRRHARRHLRLPRRAGPVVVSGLPYSRQTFLSAAAERTCRMG